MDLVILDLDDTLIDFATTRRIAYEQIRHLMTREGLDAVAYLKACTEVDRPLFAQFERGELTRAAYRLRRFSDPFERIGVAPPPGMVEAVNRVFMDCVNDSPQIHADAMPMLQALRTLGVRTAILTNGPSDGQRRKLHATGLDKEVDHVAIGEEIGASKPLARAFAHVVERFGLKPAQALMVGDSPELDHDAALEAGLAAWLLDRQGAHRHGTRTCIESLHDVAPRLRPAAGR